MPLIHRIGSDFGLLIWRMEETTVSLQKFLPEKNYSELEKEFKHPARLRQKLVVQILLNEMGLATDPHITYLASGQPVPGNFGGYLSISHSKNHVGLMYHPNHSCGLDLEEPQDRLLRIADRFLNRVEEEWIRAATRLHDLCLVWSAKEAVFKAMGGGGIIFKEQLAVEAPVRSEDGSGTCQVMFSDKDRRKLFEIHYKYLDGVMLVHTIATE